ncbi:MAG: 2Fe-2S iron-sulfur cluster binding domain-containing protein [Planctomycetes bacterium]|nr:2Fe-2S iron-sulfur cluster binding domain-containing protein [Planctomycetota bacterium]
MAEVFVSVLIISGIAAALALILVFCESIIQNYGPCKITINGKKELTVEGGKPLLSSLRERKIFLPSACGGRGTCGVCKCKVLSGAGPVLPTETPFLDAKEQKENIRLSCQVKVKNDIAIEIPDALFFIQQYQVTLTAVEDLTYDMKRFRFELTEPAEMEFVAGQYVQITCPSYQQGVEEVDRAYSIASDPKDNHFIDLIVRRVPNGICTVWMFDYLKIGDRVQMTGPYGEFRISNAQTPMIFIAGGSGMAPFVSILHQMKNSGSKRKAEYFFGGNTVRDLCLSEQMAKFEKTLADFKFIPVVSRPAPEDKWNGQTGLVTEAVKRTYTDVSGYEGYLCGSPGMIDASIKVLMELGMAKERIFYDKFA